MVVHLDATTLTIPDGSAVTVWPDHSGQANHLASPVDSPTENPLAWPVFSRSALNGRGGVSFNGSQGIMRAGPIGVTGDITAFVVFGYAGTSVARTVHIGANFGTDNNGKSIALAVDDSTPVTSVRFNNGRREFDNSSSGGPLRVMAFQQASGTAYGQVKFWRDGMLQTTTGGTNLAYTFAPTDAGIITGCGINGTGTAVSDKFTGTLGEVLVYNRILNDTEVDAVNNYLLAKFGATGGPANRPNILICVADDWGWPHAAAYGSPWIKAPNFDRVANQGVLFRNAFTTCDSCSPSRASLLTGRYPWTLAEGSTLGGSLPAKFPVYPDLFETAGYKVGYTGKGWSPGSETAGGRSRNPAGPKWNSKTATPPFSDGSLFRYNYAANFSDFLASRSPGQPFCFWYGPVEPPSAVMASSPRAAAASLMPAGNSGRTAC
jgi:hypothetical protein